MQRSKISQGIDYRLLQSESILLYSHYKEFQCIQFHKYPMDIFIYLLLDKILVWDKA